MRLEAVQCIEHIRLGIWPVFGFGSFGNHPYIRALERSGGKTPTDVLWQSIPFEVFKAP